MTGRSKADGTSRHDPPRDAQSQRSNQQGFTRRQTLEQAHSFPKKGQAVKDSAPTTLTRLKPRRIGVPTVVPIQDDMQKPDLGARVIIIQVLGNKTARGHAGTEVLSRSARHTPIDPYSVTYACNLGLPLEL